MSTSNRSAFTAGRSAAFRGCYRVLANPLNKAEEAEWLRGFDSVPASDRGRCPIAGPVPDDLLAIADPTSPRAADDRHH